RRYISTIIITTLLVFFMLTVTALADSMSSKNTMEAMGVIITECDLYFKNQGDDFDKIEEIEAVIKEYSEIEKKHYTTWEYLSIDGESLQCKIYKNPDVINVYKGRYPLYDNEIVITEVVAEELDIKMGDTVTVSCGDEKAEYMITGYFQTTNDVGRCFAINLDGSTKIGIDFVNYAGYSLSDTSRCDKLEKALNDKYGDILRCETNAENSQISTPTVVINAMKLIIYVFSVIFALVVITMVCKKAFLQEKTDIGIYKAIGFKVSSLRLQFAVRFLIVAIIGSAIASVLSYMFSSKLLSLMLRSMGITNMTVGFKILTFVIPIVIILICFFLFSYIVSRKIKEFEVTELIVE
ncbi:MAG: ABC transporter permease, partial [Lachnospiraceae bacterium]|nr:ABC transporter permease [Lachnospiraceae bacterium]